MRQLGNHGAPNEWLVVIAHEPCTLSHMCSNGYESHCHLEKKIKTAWASVHEVWTKAGIFSMHLVCQNRLEEMSDIAVSAVLKWARHMAVTLLLCCSTRHPFLWRDAEQYFHAWGGGYCTLNDKSDSTAERRSFVHQVGMLIKPVRVLCVLTFLSCNIVYHIFLVLSTLQHCICACCFRLHLHLFLYKTVLKSVFLAF